MYDNGDNTSVIAAIIILLAIGYSFLKPRLSLPHLFGGEDNDGPILAAGEMFEAKGLTSVYQGDIAGFDVNILTNDSGRVMANVQLGHNTGMHLVAVGDKTSLTDRLESFSSKFLVPVRLEGEFPKFFRMYCSPEKQIELRQVFEPVTMAQFMDFCRDNDFEIFEDEAFVSKAERGNADDDTTMSADITKFLQYNGDLLRRL